MLSFLADSQKGLCCKTCVEQMQKIAWNKLAALHCRSVYTSRLPSGHCSLGL